MSISGSSRISDASNPSVAPANSSPRSLFASRANHPLHRERGPEPPLDRAVVVAQEREDALTDDAGTQQADADRAAHGPFYHDVVESRVGGRIWLLSLWIVAGAALLVVHLVVLWRVIRSRRPEGGWRWFALIPPVAPLIAWIGGARVAPIAWVIFAAIYLALRLMEDSV